MATLRSLSKPAALVGAIALSGLAAAPALAYPPGTALTISCNATTVAPGASFICTLTNTNPAGPDDITLGGLIGAGDGVTFALASVSGQAAGTYTETLTAPSTLGTYEVIGTSADETATTQITVVASGTGDGGTPTTPQTGANVTLGLVAGLGALGLGGGLYAASRRKKV
jgi:LPXTG-motif cell wall-anchored protein